MTLDGIAIGESLSAVIATYGTPAAAIADASGNAFVWPNAHGPLRCTVDDDGHVRVIEHEAPARSALHVDVDGRSVVVRFGSLTAAEADERLAPVAEYASDASRTYRIAPDRELALSFTGAHASLQRAIFGERLALLRAGVLADDSRAPVFPFAPAQPKSAAPRPATNNEPAAIVRVDLDRMGIARATHVVISSGDPAFDETVRSRADGDHYRPATLAGRPIGSTLYREYPR